MNNLKFLKSIESDLAELSELEKEGSFYELEKKFEQRWLAMGNKLFQKLVGDAGNDRRVKKKTLSRFGEIELHEKNRFCKDVHYNKTSPYLSELIVYAGQERCYKKAEKMISKYLGIEMNAMKVHRLTNYYGKLSEQVVRPKPKMPAPDQCVYAEIDASVIFTWEGWKQVKVGRIFFGKANSKGYIIGSEYEAVRGEKEEFSKKFEQLLEGYQFLRERLVFVTDGETWIRNWIDDNFPEATQILDFYHACVYLHNFANEYFTESEGKTKKQWTDKQKALLENSQVKEVISTIEKLPERATSAKSKEGVLRYYQTNIHRMDYKAYKNIGAGVIGSGAIEATHRSLVQDRCKCSGQVWTKDGAQHVLNLRCLEQSEHWNQVQDIIRNGIPRMNVA